MEMSHDEAGETSRGQLINHERPSQPDSLLDPKGCQLELGTLSFTALVVG